jgi:Fanconi anemia group M protein
MENINVFNLRFDNIQMSGGKEENLNIGDFSAELGIKELSIKPREYQVKIFQSCIKDNCLVILPTGTGKTLIALMLAIERFKKFPLEKILILAPTRPLAEQHLEYFKKNLPDGWADIQLFTGKTEAGKRREIWQTAEIIFSTPQCIANDIKKRLYDLSDVSLLIEDECHRCLKNYAYNFIAQQYRFQAKNQRILGLTASPGSDRETITRVCENLGINSVEIRTRESDDVKPYLKELEFEKIDVAFPPEFEEIRVLLDNIYDEKINELKNRKVLFTNANKITLLETQRRVSKAISSGNKNPNLLMAASVCAIAIKVQHALELLETQTISSFTNYLRDLYQQASDKKSRGVQRLVTDPRFSKAYTLATTTDLEHPKLVKLVELVKDKIVENKKAKIIVFSQYRDSVQKIVDTINKIGGIKAGVFVGQAKKSFGNKESGLNQKEQKQLIEKFSSGEINVLVSTSIGEEGLDLPEVAEVIFYEPVPSAIRKIQRSGRTARMHNGSLKILVTKKTRDEAYHYASISKEKRMYKAIENIKQELDGERLDLTDREKQKRLF